MASGKLDYPLRSHLQNVYACTAAASFSAAIGSCLYYNEILDGGWWIVGASLICLVILFTPRDPDGGNDGFRFTFLNAFGFCLGIQSGPALKAVWDMDPSIILSALMITSVIFVCFSVVAIIAPERQYLWMAAPLLSIFGAMVVAQILNYFIQSKKITYLQVIAGPIVGSLFILVDTQRIIAKFRDNDRDYIWHALLLFIDLISLFKDVLEWFASKERSRRGDTK